MIVTSLENKEIKRISKLSSKKYRELEKEFIVEGEHLVEEAYKKGLLKKIILLENEDIKIDTEKLYVSYDVMKKISSLDTPPKVIGICHLLKEKMVGSKVLVLDGVQDPGNLGTIIRSSVAFNIDTVILSKNTVDLYNSKTIRATQGMMFNLNIIRCDIKEAIQQLKKKGYFIYSTDVEKGMNVKKVKRKEKFALIMGNEGNGVSKEVKNLSDISLCINTNKKVESLNVGVATSILLYELGGNSE